MLTEGGYFWFGLAAYTLGIAMITLSFRKFEKYVETKNERNFLLGMMELLAGLTLAFAVTKVLWENTPLAAFLAY